MHPAKLWKPLHDGTVQCRLCAHTCVIHPGAHGFCGVRHNVEGQLRTCVGRCIAAANLDPIEKKPLYHVLPATTTFSFGTMGCNFSCSFCQNHTLSAPPREGRKVCGQCASGEVLVHEALRSGARSVAYTYNEPTVFFELMEETALCAREHGLLNIMVSNGYQSTETLNALDGLIAACNIDLKAFSDEFYKEYCGASLAPVLRNLKAIVRMGWWLEITTLLIPDANDDARELRDMAQFIRDELGANVPWHISRFHPAYHLTDRPATAPEALERAWSIGKEAGLSFVYIGNLHGHPSEHTACPSCGNIVIRRTGYRAKPTDIPACSTCGTTIPGLWSTP